MSNAEHPFSVKVTTLNHKYHGGNVSITEFSEWKHAVSFACPFEKSANYEVEISRGGERVYYYEEGGADGN